MSKAKDGGAVVGRVVKRRRVDVKLVTDDGSEVKLNM